MMNKIQRFFLYRTPFVEMYTKACDYLHHRKYSFKERFLKDDKGNLRYYLTKQYHIIEKGMSLPNPRVGFGQPKILGLIEKSKFYEGKYGSDSLILTIKKTIFEYMNFHDNEREVLSNDFVDVVSDFLHEKVGTGTGGFKVINKIDASPLTLATFSEFAASRASVRDFSIEAVSKKQIYEAVDAAKNAPSVCNRQGWKVHLYSEKSKIKNLLAYQNGNTGFSDSINQLIIVTADAKAFTLFESNQLFIDGGLFSMNLLLALHASGLGACPLNTCCPYFVENKIRQLASIPQNERLIMMIAVGALKETYKVAYSTKSKVDDILTQH